MVDVCQSASTSQELFNSQNELDDNNVIIEIASLHQTEIHVLT